MSTGILVNSIAAFFYGIWSRFFPIDLTLDFGLSPYTQLTTESPIPDENGDFGIIENVMFIRSPNAKVTIVWQLGKDIAYAKYRGQSTVLLMEGLIAAMPQGTAETLTIQEQLQKFADSVERVGDANILPNDPDFGAVRTINLEPTDNVLGYYLWNSDALGIDIGDDGSGIMTKYKGNKKFTEIAADFLVVHEFAHAAADDADEEFAYKQNLMYLAQYKYKTEIERQILIDLGKYAKERYILSGGNPFDVPEIGGHSPIRSCSTGGSF